jgi:uncharacterized protein (DUF302 family)
MSDYGISVTLPIGFAESVDRTRAALADEGFGVLTEIDVAATLLDRLGVDMAPYLILGACNPPLAHQALQADPAIGLLLPCNVVVRALEESHTLVDAMNPDVMVTATGNAALAPVAEQARTRLVRAIATLEAAGATDE